MDETAGTTGAGHRVSTTTLQWAREAFERDVQELLDDPTHLLADAAHATGLSVPEAIETYRRIGTDLGVDFDELITRVGSPFEISRLRGLTTPQS